MQFLGVYPANETPARTKERCFYIQNVESRCPLPEFLSTSTRCPLPDDQRNGARCCD
jgi:hypothetical protein